MDQIAHMEPSEIDSTILSELSKELFHNDNEYIDVKRQIREPFFYKKD